MSNQVDHRIFGFTELGQFRANLARSDAHAPSGGSRGLGAHQARGRMMRRVSNPNYVVFGSTEMVVVFATDRGQLRTNDTGDFFYREFADGKFTCASPDLERQLIDAPVRAGVPVGITRSTFNRAVIWKVRVIAPVTEMPQSVPAATTGKPNGLPERLYAKVEPPALAFPECIPVTTPVNNQEAKPEGVNLITRCMRAAIEAAADATARGNELNFPVSFSGSDIQDLASTLYIQASRNLLDPRGGDPYRKPNGRANGYTTNGAAVGA